MNEALQKNNSAYRLLNGSIAPITLETEVVAINDAINACMKFPSVNIHLSRSLDMLSDRGHPDYRNSIKESISAIESYCNFFLNDQKGTLGKLLAFMNVKTICIRR
ncbi:MAG: hypothetical protein EOP48_00330 [Sphingobacteriales bacterium]|nr:MAG: hypothetical protein EOP48_00330 [Sphingobacteriales bacterium]